MLWALSLCLQLFGFLCLCIVLGVALGGYAFVSLALEICREILQGKNNIAVDDSGWSEDEVEEPHRSDTFVVEELPVTPMPIYMGDVLLPQTSTMLAWYFSRGQALMLEY